MTAIGHLRWHVPISEPWTLLLPVILPSYTVFYVTYTSSFLYAMDYQFEVEHSVMK